MDKQSILKITSSENNTIGTGFVIDFDEKGVIVVTCSHVVNNCYAESLLVEGLIAIVKNDYKFIGLDLAILYVEGLKREPFIVEEQEPKKVKLFGYTYFNTKIRSNIKAEGMNDINAKYDVSLTGEGQTIEIIRLSSQHKISNGYSG
ncbi:MAG: serine protease, partial [Epsilonproteobacteria bacterium]|nr:serine protease [Campylobacterota bacterium]